MLEATFWVLLTLGVYPYAIYPILVRIAGAVRRVPIAADISFTPRVTVITAAYNEAAHIEASVVNKLEQDYPPELLEVIVVPEETTDGTDEIVQRIVNTHGRVRLLRQVPRQGKTSGLNLAVPLAEGEIIVFADANSIYRSDTVRHLVKNFADPSVGYVTGKMVYVNP